MIQHKEHFLDSLFHRLSQCIFLAEKPATLSYLPEILIRSIHDTYRLVFEALPLSNSSHICKELGITLSEAQEALLQSWEDALRGEERYAELSVSKAEALEIALLLKTRLEKVSFS